jgi:hypothetical protein
MRLPTCLIGPALEAEEQSIRPALINGQKIKAPPAQPIQPFSFAINPQGNKHTTGQANFFSILLIEEAGQRITAARWPRREYGPPSLAHSVRDDPLKWPALLHIVPSSETLCRDFLTQARSWLIAERHMIAR